MDICFYIHENIDIRTLHQMSTQSRELTEAKLDMRKELDLFAEKMAVKVIISFITCNQTKNFLVCLHESNLIARMGKGSFWLF